MRSFETLNSLKRPTVKYLTTEETLQTSNIVNSRSLFVDSQPKEVVVHPLPFAGMAHESKIIELRTNLTKDGATAMVISEEDEIAWIFNLRGEGDNLVAKEDQRLIVSNCQFRFIIFYL